MAETGHKKTFNNTVAKKGREDIKIKILCLIAPAKFQSAMGVFHHPTSQGNYQILYSNIFALSILWMVYYLSVLSSV